MKNKNIRTAVIWTFMSAFQLCGLAYYFLYYGYTAIY